MRDVVIMRASQLDAGRLDNELTSMLREQFMRIFSLFQPVHQLSLWLLRIGSLPLTEFWPQAHFAPGCSLALCACAAHDICAAAGADARAGLLGAIPDGLLCLTVTWLRWRV